MKNKKIKFGIYKIALLPILFFVFGVLAIGLFVFAAGKKTDKRILAQITGTTYYVSPTGNDGNSGTSASYPWKTIDRLNSVNLQGGDGILFETNQTFDGKLYFDAQDTGTETSPIIVSTYGSSGKATIRNTSDVALFTYNTQGLEFSHLIFQGPGRTNSNKDGVNIYNDLANNTKLRHIYFDDIEVKDFGLNGLSLGGWNGTSGFENVQISNSSFHDNGKNGLVVYGQSLYSNKNVRVFYSRAFNNSGITSLSTNSGSGIILSSVDGGVIEHSLAWNNGFNCTANEGPVGIWAFDSNNITIQHNESYSNRTAGPADGGGFDLDGGVTNSVMQYNYSHDNDGAGFGLYQYSGAPTWNNNTVRYNISQNDGRKNNQAGIAFWNGGSGINNAYIYNNTIFTTPSLSGSPKAMVFYTTTNNVKVFNNIFIATGGLRIVESLTQQSSAEFKGNNYYSSGSPFAIKWNNTTYSSLDAWRTATGFEKNGTANTGYAFDPGLIQAGGGTTIGNTDQLASLSSYKLSSNSPMINAGLDIGALAGLIVGGRDFYGSTIPQNGPYDIGVHEFVNIVSSSPSPTSTSPSGQNMPTGDLYAWRQIFTEDFLTDVPLGGFPSSTSYSNKWSFYLDGWPDTAGKQGAPSRYYPSKVLSVSGGVLNKYLHTENGTPMGAALIPILANNNADQLYGKYTIRFKSESLAGFKTAWLLWPQSGNWPYDGEIDFPEGNLDGKINAFMHRQGASSGSDQDAFFTNVTYSDWHTASVEWTPESVKFILDDVTIGTSVNRIPNTPMHYVMQTESCLNGCPAPTTAGNLQVDWFVAYAPAPLPSSSPSSAPSPSPSPTPDTVAPVVSITNPTNGSTVTGRVTLQATATDNVKVAKVEFYIDQKLKTSDTASPYSYSWDTRKVSSGNHEIKAIAYDTAGNKSTTTVTVNR